LTFLRKIQVTGAGGGYLDRRAVRFSLCIKLIVLSLMLAIILG
jgi:hypothetical protein